MEKDEVIIIRVSKELKNWVNKKAKQRETTPSKIIREILETLKSWEDADE